MPNTTQAVTAPTAETHDILFRGELWLKAVTPQCLAAKWSYQNDFLFLDPDDDEDDRSKWIVDVFISRRRASSKSIIVNVPGSYRSATIAPLPSGGDVAVKLCYETSSGVIRHDTMLVSYITLPGNLYFENQQSL